MGLFLIFVLMRFSLRLLINHNVQPPPEFVIVFHRPCGGGGRGGGVCITTGAQQSPQTRLELTL